MCYQCVEDVDAADLVSPKETDPVIEAIRALYDFHATGGPLHCQLDDFNLDDAFMALDEDDVKWFRLYDDCPGGCRPLATFILDELRPHSEAMRTRIVWDAHRRPGMAIT